MSRTRTFNTEQARAGVASTVTGMRYASVPVALLWLVTFGLLALAGASKADGAPLLLLIGGALASPYLILRGPGPNSPTAVDVPQGLLVVRAAIREPAAVAR